MERTMLKRMNARAGLLRKLSLSATRSKPALASRPSFAAPSASASTSVWNRTFTTETQPGRPRRRMKQKYEQFSEAKLATGMIPTTTSLESPFEYNSGDSIEDYKKKAELSPWTPVPDSVARKIFDRALPSEDEYDVVTDGDQSKANEVHVELGSGDGRVNFHAIEYGVGESIGIEVDEDVVKLAEERLARIYPQPNLKFVTSDLMDPNSPAWLEYVPRATILTMYFATDGLQKIRPYLERALRGKHCKIFTCGYPMPGWDSQIVETVLDIPIHFYDWGNENVNMMVVQPSDSIVDSLPPGAANPLHGNSTGTGFAPSDNMDQYMGRKNKKSTFVKDPLPGYHPDDLIDYGWMDDFDEDKDEANETGESKTEEGIAASRMEALHNFKPPK